VKKKPSQEEIEGWLAEAGSAANLRRGLAGVTQNMRPLREHPGNAAA
jgi:hypothetical protein